MNTFFLRIWSICSCIQDYLRYAMVNIQTALGKVRFRLMRKIPFHTALLWRRIRLTLGLYGREYRRRERVAVANQRCLLPEASLHYTWTAQRRELLEFYATWGQSLQIASQIERCAETLRAGTQLFVETGEPLILAPLHMTSDVLSVIVASKTTSLQTTVVVSSNAEEWNEEARALGNVNLDYCSVENTTKRIGLNLATACMDVAESKRVLVMFADMVPDYTIRNSEMAQDKYACHLFNRPAYLHHGLIRLSKVTKANILFFYLYFDKGLQVKVFPAVKYHDASMAMPGIIEQAVTESPADWLLWHHHCLYFINEG